ncbi:MAG: (Fe-S)-binding protein [Calditerrivibrio sp.]|nr:(Fe-S)-binding protein [Calditerrivibrio sp.]MCA1933059.1 (Fe-S)-binding protein [Calditerrivibrio sp.]MCA1979980.1 (Fe-S)-binding protein [Calditerrivibrio sp.]
MENILQELKELENLTIQCMKCGTCQAYCPLYQKDFDESSVARGKISLIESVFEGRIEKATSILKYLDYCVMCGKCKINCPSGVKTDEIFLKAKAILRKIEQLPSWGKAVLKIVMEKPELLAKLSPLMHIGLRFGAKKVKGDIFKPLLSSFAERNIYDIASKTFSSQYGGWRKAEKETMKVIFYPGCAINMIFTNWGKQIIEILNHFGVSVYVPEVNKCCGIPAATLGELDTYKKMVIENHNLFKTIDATHIITSCPTCQYGLHEMGEKITGVSSDKKFIDIMIFLEDVLKIELKKITDEKFTLHLPCHYDPTKEQQLNNVLIKLGTNFAPLENRSCCGFGGTFNMKNYKHSKDIVKNKSSEVKEKKFSRVYSPCPGCVMQLTDSILNDGLMDVETTHPIELVYESVFGKRFSNTK